MRSRSSAYLLAMLLLAACGREPTIPDDGQSASPGSVASASDDCPACVVGPLSYTRGSGAVETYTHTFAGDPSASYLIEIDDAKSRGALASVILNGVDLLAPTGGVANALALGVTVQAQNTLVVQLKGKRGSMLQVSLKGGQGTIGEEGGSVVSPWSRASVAIEAGAVTGKIRVALRGVEPVPAEYTALSGLSIELEVDYSSVQRINPGKMSISIPTNNGAPPGETIALRAQIDELPDESLWMTAVQGSGGQQATGSSEVRSFGRSVPLAGAVRRVRLSVESYPSGPLSAAMRSAPAAALAAGVSPLSNGSSCPAYALSGWERLSGTNTPALFRDEKSRSLSNGAGKVIVLIHGWQRKELNCLHYLDINRPGFDLSWKHDPAPSYFKDLLSLLHTSGFGAWPIVVVDYPTFNSFQYSGAALAPQLDALQATYGVSVVLVGHSMGGLVARAAASQMQKPPEAILTLATPHEGSLLAVDDGTLVGNTPVDDLLAFYLAPRSEGKKSLIMGLRGVESNVPMLAYGSAVPFAEFCTPGFTTSCPIKPAVIAEPSYWAELTYNYVGAKLCELGLAQGESLGECQNDGAVAILSALPVWLPSVNKREYAGFDHRTMKSGAGAKVDQDLVLDLRQLLGPPPNPASSSPIAFYPLDGNGLDASGNGNNGTPVGSLTAVPGRPGGQGQAMRFASGQYISVPSNNLLRDLTSEMTLMFWVKRGASPISSGMLPVARRVPGDIIHFLAYSQPGGFAYQCCSSGGSATGSFFIPSGSGLATINDGRWHQVAMVRKFGAGGFTTLYLDGDSLTGSYNAGVAAAVPTQIVADLLIGRQASSSPGEYIGLLDDVMIWNRTLSAAEVSAYHIPDTGSMLGVGFGAEQFASIPSGTFTMGATNGNTNEQPPHSVTLSQPFRMQKTEVTQGQWRQVMGTSPSIFSNCDACPVDRVSWDDIQQFLTALNQQDPGKGYRLPTEAEWEYAARAGTTGDYNVPGQAVEALGWIQSNSGARTQPVAQKIPNAWGLFDMHGNVWEWVQDRYSDTYYSVSPSQDPQGPATGTSRTLRGGAWIDFAVNARSAVRGGAPTAFRDTDHGFRLALGGSPSGQWCSTDGNFTGNALPAGWANTLFPSVWSSPGVVQNGRLETVAGATTSGLALDATGGVTPGTARITIDYDAYRVLGPAQSVNNSGTGAVIAFDTPQGSFELQEFTTRYGASTLSFRAQRSSPAWPVSTSNFTIFNLSSFQIQPQLYHMHAEIVDGSVTWTATPQSSGATLGPFTQPLTGFSLANIRGVRASIFAQQNQTWLDNLQIRCETTPPPPPPPPPPPAPAAITVSNVVSGVSQPAGPFTATLDAGTANQVVLSIAKNGSVTFPNVTSGSHDVRLTGAGIGVGSTCSIAPNFAQNASASAGTTTTVNFSINCVAVPVTVTTQAATRISRTGFEMNGTVNPQGVQTVGWFEYGPTTNLGGLTTAGDLGSGTSPRALVAALTGLPCGTPYYFRAAAGPTTSGPVTRGSILTVTTLACPTSGTAIVNNSISGPAQPAGPFTVTVDAGGSSPIIRSVPKGGSVVISGLSAGSHEFRLTGGGIGTGTACSITGGFIKNAVVPLGGSVSVPYAIVCK